MKTEKMTTISKTDDLRDSFLDFFSKKDHRIIASDSLVPQNDPTLLFTGAGMNQFKEYFLGLKKDMKRAASSQKCLRTGDLDNVGKTAYHHSFFEMLGNFSFGDYFKEEAIVWAWEYLTEVLKIPAQRLRISVHKTDSEALKVWRDKIKIKTDWIYPLGDESNFWPANAPKDGPNGPCGPCSEIYFDMGKELARPGEDAEHIESKRFAEIWNLVFTQFDRQDVNKLAPLKNKNIDTGMGLERLACVMQGKNNNFDIDIFAPIHAATESALGIKRQVANLGSVNAIADHVRAVAFAMGDGVLPSNDGRGYVIRKLIRRALWHAHQVVPGKRLSGPFLFKVLSGVEKTMAKHYPEIKESAKSIEAGLKAEEERFLDTLDKGLKILEKKLSELSAKKQRMIPGDIVFELYDTYGFPDELTLMIASDQGFKIDQKGFESLMEKQRERAKQSSQIADSIFVSTDLEKKILALNPTKFLGYEALKGKGKVLFTEIHDQKGVIVLDQTPCYGESGGQVGDQGALESKQAKAKIVDTKKRDQVFLHYVEMERGEIHLGDVLEVTVDENRRNRIMRNHTATHLLHAALRQVLGPQVRQLGSLVAPDRLRFDYSYGQALSADQITQIENLVNAEIMKSTPLSKEEKSLKEAKDDGAIAFFGEKYGDKVRVVAVPGFSKELCGGTHCEDTGQIGSFMILSESSIASGTRRMEAVTGEGALEYAQKLRRQITQIAGDLKTTPEELGTRIAKLKDQIKKLEKERAPGGASAVDPKKILEKAVKVGNVQFAAYKTKEMAAEELRALSDALRSGSQNTVYFLGTANDDKIHFLLGVSHDLVKGPWDMKSLGNEIAPMIQATSGGRVDLIQGGGKNTGQLDQQWDVIIQTAASYLKSRSK